VSYLSYKPFSRSRINLFLSSSSGYSIFVIRLIKNSSGIECWGFEDAKILRISLKTFDKIMSKDYILAKNCMLEMEKRIRRLYRQLKNLTSSNIEKKLAAKLYRLGTQYGLKENKIEVRMKVRAFYFCKNLRKTMIFVTNIHLQHIIINVDVQVFLRKSQISCCALHISLHTTRISRTFHKNLPCTKEQIEFSTKGFLGTIHLFFVHTKQSLNFKTFAKVQFIIRIGKLRC